MSPNPIHKALSILCACRVRALLMGGQACILYGAAEFSRDIDIAIVADEPNLGRLRACLSELQGEPVFVPALSPDVLRRGHACHFRCAAAGLEGLRIDVMSVLRGCDPFEKLWSRRRTVSIPGIGAVHLLGLADLVQAKKTQRDKDWPMIRRLLEADYYRGSRRPSRQRITFWLREIRTGEILITLSKQYTARARRLTSVRPALRPALRGDRAGVDRALLDEQEAARAADRKYWAPLRAELVRWRLQREK